MQPALSSSIQGFSEQQGRCNVTNWTVCWQPVCLTGFSLPWLASGQNIAHIQHSSRARKGYFSRPPDCYIIYLVLKTHVAEKDTTKRCNTSQSSCHSAVAVCATHPCAFGGYIRVLFSDCPLPPGPPPTHSLLTHTHARTRQGEI